MARRIALLLTLLLLIIAVSVVGQRRRASAPPDATVAHVNGVPIVASMVAFRERTLRQAEPSSSGKDFWAAALHQLVNEEILFQAAAHENIHVDDAWIQMITAQSVADIYKSGDTTTIAQFEGTLAQLHLTRDEYASDPRILQAGRRTWTRQAVIDRILNTMSPSDRADPLKRDAQIQSYIDARGATVTFP
jgi:hypothetical protein